MIEIVLELDVSELPKTMALLTQAIKDLYSKLSRIEQRLDRLEDSSASYQEQEVKAIS